MAHKKSSFQAKTIILSPFYSQKHKDFLSRKHILGYKHFKTKIKRYFMGLSFIFQSTLEKLKGRDNIPKSSKFFDVKVRDVASCIFSS